MLQKRIDSIADVKSGAIITGEFGLAAIKLQYAATKKIVSNDVSITPLSQSFLHSCGCGSGKVEAITY